MTLASLLTDSTSDIVTIYPKLAPAFDGLAADPLETIDQLRREVDQLSAELHLLRGRDEMLHGQVHRLDEELRLAARLQQDFLPKTLPTVGPVRFHTLFRPAGHVSGDFYDVMRLDEKHVGFYIADAVGHGMPAALLTMFIKHALATKQITPEGYRLLTAGETMTRLNRSLIEQGLSAATFATALYGTINTETRRLTFSRGGHPHPILLRADGRFEALETEGGLLGIFPDEAFTEYTIDLQPGDKLLLFTDGIELIYDEDQHTGEGTQTQHWLKALHTRRHQPAKQMLEEFAGIVDRECNGLPPRDDLTIMAVEIV